MFTGIIESIGTVKSVDRQGSNVHFTIASALSHQLKVDQSVSHNGVCLTVVDLLEGAHVVTAIEETLVRSNLGALETHSLVNLERSMLANGRLDGHIVQGHVDTTALCQSIDNLAGSWVLRFSYDSQFAHLLVDKGSICLNGISLTLINPSLDQFSVAIIPYTYEHTNIHQLQPGTSVNIEFDIIGKYIGRYLQMMHQQN